MQPSPREIELAPAPRHGRGPQASGRMRHRRLSRSRRKSRLSASPLVVAVLGILFVVSVSATESNAPPRSTLLRRVDAESSEQLDTDRRHLTVFGADGRQPVSNASSFPYNAVGLLKWSADRICTVSLISSKLALTAADCVLNRDGSRRASTLPNPELEIGGTAAQVAHVVKIHRQSDYWKTWTQQAYAILELDKSLGDTFGTLLLPTSSDLNQTDSQTLVQMVGFDADAATSGASLKFERCTCYFPALFNGPQYMLHHDCDTSPVGSPGSVLLVRYADLKTYIIGIHTNAVGDGVPEIEPATTDASFTQEAANRGVLGPFINEQLQYMLKNPASLSMDSSSSRDVGSKNHESSSASSRTVGDSGAVSTLRPSDGSSGGTATVRSSISSTAAYVCIGFVGCAWICIVFIAVRHVRKAK